MGIQNTPVDTRRKLNVHKRFRRRPGRLLNVLYTFNLRPVSTGTDITENGYNNKDVKRFALSPSIESHTLFHKFVIW